MKPYYAHGGITIYHANCLWVFPFEHIGAVVSDPPYGINLDTRRSRGRKESIPIAGDAEPFDPIPILDLGVPTILWGANHFCDRLPISRGWLVWNKVIFDGAFGTRSMNKQQAEVELAWTNCVPRPKGIRHLWDGNFRASESGTDYHPAQKPVELMQWCLGFIEPHLVVCDPYMGSGPTLVAAKQLNRRAIGIELEERYCEIAAKRLEQEVLAL